MEVAPISVPPGGFRGRGRGGFDRGRGRGMGRGGFMGHMGRGAIPMMPGGRGMRPRGGPPQGYRGGFIPRGGPSMRGSRPPMYNQPLKQHTGAENNKTVSPVPTASVPAIATVAETPAAPAAAAAPAATTTTVAVAAAPAATTAAVKVETNGTVAQQPIVHTHPQRGSYIPRGRGGLYSRGGRGGYNSQTNGGMYHHSMGGPPNSEHGMSQMPMRRGAPRGRGGYGMTRPPMHQSHPMNSQSLPMQGMKRGAPGGPPGPKRGRYEGGPYSQRPMAPKYHHPPAPQHAAPMQPMQSYAPPPPQTHHHQHHPPQPQSHHAYPPHDQSQAVDPYAQSYASVPPAQTNYNGYGQSGSYAAAAPAPQASNAYAAPHHATGSEYDQSGQYHAYSASSYGTQQDTRYQNYGQDYTQQYGAPAVDYNTTTQTDYAQQHSQAYDERAYAGYDTQSYQQSYSNAAGYY